MKFLIISPIGLSLFLIPHLGISSEVEKIYFSVLDSEKKKIGKGMEKIPGWEKLVMEPQWQKVINENTPESLVVFIDDIGAGELGKMLRTMGYRVIGGSPFTDRIEDDRQFATDLTSRIMDVPESKSFTSWSEAISYIKSQEKDQGLVFKPNDADAPKEYTYASKDGPDHLLEVMESFQNEWKWKEDFQIQKFIKGTEVDFSAFFNGKEFITNSMVLYFENKPLMNGDIGPATGGSIAVEFYRKPENIFWPILQKLKPALKKANYKGQISMNCIVSDEDKKPYFLEYCGRVGYPSFPLDITLIEEKVPDGVYKLFMAMADGHDVPDLFPTGKIGATISCFVPPAPMDKGAEEFVKGQPMDWDKKWDKYFFPYYCEYDEKMKKIVLSGCSTWILQITCADSTLDGALSMLYDTYVPKLTLKNVEYRTDCGESARKRIKSLKDAKVIT